MQSRMQRPVILPLLTLLTASVLAGITSSAWATCGDYLQPSGEWMTAPVSESDQQIPAERQPRCHGPYCSRAPAPMPLPVTPTVTMPKKLLPHPTVILQANGLELLADLIETSLSHPIGQIPEIFRPPRAT